MGTRLSWGLAALAALVMSATGCNKGGGDSSEAEGQGGEQRASSQQNQAEEPPVAAECGRCMRPLASVGTWPRVAVIRVNYGGSRDFFDMQNLTEETVSLDGWTVSNGSVSAPLPPGQALAPRQQVRVHLGPGTNNPDNLYVQAEGLSLDPDGEVAVFASANQTADELRGYARWGNAGSGGHLAIARESEMWMSQYGVPLCGGEGFNQIAGVGNITIPRGWRSMPDSCFEQEAEPTGPGGFPGR